jgi:hypothetical protein
MLTAEGWRAVGPAQEVEAQIPTPQIKIIKLRIVVFNRTTSDVFAYFKAHAKDFSLSLWNYKTFRHKLFISI